MQDGRPDGRLHGSEERPVVWPLPPLRGAVWQLAIGEPLVDPCLDLSLHPRDPILAQPYPFRELACLLEPRDVLRRVWNAEHALNSRFETSRFCDMRDAPCEEASRCPSFPSR
jgi:hypothetical protein